MTEQAPKRITLPSVALGVVLTSPLFFLFNFLRDPASGRAAWFGAFTIVLATMVRWELRKHNWFWATIAAIVVCHVPLVLYVPWSAHWVPSFLIAPFCVVDGIAILAVIQTVEKRMAVKDVPGE
jgi:hypothetical protein